MQTLRFISEAAQDMTAKRRSLFGSDAKVEPRSANAVDSDTDEADFFDMASPDTKSEVSQYHDCQSEGVSSSSASQVDPTEEAHAPIQNGGISPGGMGGSLWERWQTQVTRGDAAEETLRNHRQQYEQMSAQLFSLKQQHQELSEQNQSLQQQNQALQQQNAALQSDKASLEQELRQQQADREDETLTRDQAVEEHQREMHDVKQRYSNLYNRVEAMREQQRQEEDEERERCRSWGYLLRQTGRATGCVALGAIGVLTLIHVCEGRDGLKALSRAQ